METILKHPRTRAYFRFQPCTPNATTMAAMQETLSGKYAGVIDTATTESFINSILGDEDGQV